MLILSGLLTIILNGIVLYVGLTSTKLDFWLLISDDIIIHNGFKIKIKKKLAVKSGPPPSGTFLIQPC